MVSGLKSNEWYYRLEKLTESRYGRAKEAKVVKPSNYKEDSIPASSTGTKPFTARRNNMVVSTLPCGTPSDWGKEDEAEEENTTWKVRLERKDFTTTSMPGEYICWRKWYCHIVSYVFSKMRNTANMESWHAVLRTRRNPNWKEREGCGIQGAF